jgi:ubiquinone/menaquinone biosynthesis C-methylase UbiE
MDELERYYRLRAPDYEHLYYRPDATRRAELNDISEAMRTTFAGRRVLEVACGTAYWTTVLSTAAAAVVATDAAPEMLELARQKSLPNNVELRLADAYRLDQVEGAFDAALAGFWLSHVPKAKINEFLTGLHDRLGSGAVVLMVDNLNIPGYGGELVQVAHAEDTFKRRELRDGSTLDVLKNYYSNDELREMLAPRTRDLQIQSASYYWWMTYWTV